MMRSKRILEVAQLFRFVALSGASLLMASPLLAATLLVDDDSVECPGAGFGTIQAAVDAANAGDTVRVCPGTYPEQVEIDKRLKLSGVSIANASAPVIKPIGVAMNSTRDGVDAAAIVLVDNVEDDDVELENLTIDGSMNGLAACTPELIGLYFDHSSGKAEHMAVRNVRLGAGLEGCRSGRAIVVDSGSGAADVDILKSTIHDYQKDGILASGPETRVRIEKNTVRGDGPTDAINQNGIFLLEVENADVKYNAVIDHFFTEGLTATSILVRDVKKAKLENNTFGNGETNIFIEASKVEVKRNTLFGAAFDGMSVRGDDNKIEDNRILSSDVSGILLCGSGNKIENNEFNEAPIGLQIDGSCGNNTLKDNDFYNVETNVNVF